MTKKNNPFSGNPSNGPASGKAHIKPMTSTRNKDVPQYPTETSLNKDTLIRNMYSNTRTEHRTFYDDPISVRQWAAETDPNTSVDFAEYGIPDTSCEIDMPGLRVAPQDSGSFLAHCSSASHVSFPVSSGIPSDDLSAAYSYHASNGLAPAFRGSLGIDTSGAMDSLKNYETWPYPTPTAEEMAYSASAVSYAPFSGGSSFEPRFADWPASAFLPEEGVSMADLPRTSQTLAWSPVLATDPSISSSYSRSSYMAMQPNTPLSPVPQESNWPTASGLTEEEEAGFYPAFSLGESFSIPSGHSNGQSDAMSTLRPSRPFQRAPVSGMDFWTAEESHPPLYPAPALVGFGYTRRSSDAETNTNAREHPLYQVGPKEDGLYHCPFAGSEECSHKPEKLKCNYDKHLDSHLKPYRCKLSGCSTLAFSSTACLLRHEREAHGMHGHGDKPHLCTYQDCERSILGNGFPRRWNLFDHMRRVHNYSGPASSPRSSSPTSSVSSYCQGQTTLPVRKRRTSSNAKAEPMKKSKSNSSNKPVMTVASHGTQRQSMQVVWQQQKASINARMARLGPSDTSALKEIHADYAKLQSLAMNMRT
ncbi:MAG: hypothetical protein Q9220_005654 [cf. Caloplaca sp. 1 TL-2023]